MTKKTLKDYMISVKMNTQKPNSKNSYNKQGFYFFLFTMGFSSLWAGYFIFFKNTIDLEEYKKPVETASAESATPAEPTAEPDKLWISTEELIAQGSTVYKTQCAVCHGAKGLGDGTPGLIPPPRNFVEGKWKQGGSSKDLFITLQKGLEGTAMVSFQHLSKSDRWALVHYIRSITNNKVPDDEKELEEFASQAQ